MTIRIHESIIKIVCSIDVYVYLECEQTKAQMCRLNGSILMKDVNRFSRAREYSSIHFSIPHCFIPLVPFSFHSLHVKYVNIVASHSHKFYGATDVMEHTYRHTFACGIFVSVYNIFNGKMDVCLRSKIGTSKQF